MGQQVKGYFGFVAEKQQKSPSETWQKLGLP
jgi:hypothetical protein